MLTRRSWFTALMGLGAVGGGLVGLVGFVLALASALTGNFLAAGVCLLAAAVAFGLLLVSLVPR